MYFECIQADIGASPGDSILTIRPSRVPDTMCLRVTFYIESLSAHQYIYLISYSKRKMIKGKDNIYIYIYIRMDRVDTLALEYIPLNTKDCT